jgi:predicted DNA-binding protein
MASMKRTQIRLTDEQWQRLKRVAAERGVSMSEVVREAIDQYIAAQNARDRREHAIRAIGGFRSGRADVSECHDDYLADALER